MTEHALTFDDLGFSYRPGEWVLRHCSGTVERGSVYSILGPNGRGKSTLLRLILGLQKPVEGTVTLQGHAAFVPQLFQTGFDYPVLTMVLMGRARRLGFFGQPGRADERAAIAALDRLGLADLADRPFHSLSGGQRQLVILARALVSEAGILVMDEPTSALDLRNQALLLEWIDKLSHEEGLTIVMTTHHPHHALAVSDQVMLMLPETCIAGAAAEMLTSIYLEQLYGVPIEPVSITHKGRAYAGLVPLLKSAHSPLGADRSVPASHPPATHPRPRN